MTNKDQLYSDARQSIAKFSFDQDVAAVFDDMISRSVPGYRQILELIPTLVRQLNHTQIKQSDQQYYDLGCSLGAGMLAIAQGLGNHKANIIGVDNSTAMLAKAEPLLKKFTQTHNCHFFLKHADINDFSINQASLVLMNFTLQFIPLAQRQPLIERIYQNTNQGGMLIISEKISFDDPTTNAALINIHHQYKADQGYSQLEISQKRDSIENVLIPETLDTHIERLRSAGFSIVTPWIQNLQFVSILAIK